MQPSVLPRPTRVEREDQKEETGMAYALRKQDLQRKIRVRKSANLILFAVDASWSMAVSERMQATKGAIMSLLTDAYQRRDRVGLVVFHKDRALPCAAADQLGGAGKTRHLRTFPSAARRRFLLDCGSPMRRYKKSAI